MALQRTRTTISTGTTFHINLGIEVENSSSSRTNTGIDIGFEFCFDSNTDTESSSHLSISHTWTNNILVLSPIVEQWVVLAYAREHNAREVEAFKVIVPEILRTSSPFD